MAQLRIYVFGPPRLERDGEPLEFGLRRAQALLVYLAVKSQPQSRDALATLLWPEYSQREARANLRRNLYRLTQALGDAILTSTSDTVAITPEADLWIDSAAFEERITSDTSLAEAIALYHDDFLAGFSLPDCPEFDEWQFFERERLRQLLAHGLEHLVQQTSARGDWDAAADCARRWVALDPLHEPAQRALLEAYAQAGQAAAAKRQYQELLRLLEVELGAEPEAATQQLYEAIRTRRFPPATAAAPASAESVAMFAPDVTDRPVALHDSGTAAVMPLVGRERELTELLQFLTEPGGARLITLTGPGGVGKTRLALAVGEQARAHLAYGSSFVSLAEVPEVSGIPAAIAARLGLTANDEPVERQLAAALHRRDLLLILDNFEHLLDATALIAGFLAQASQLRIVITSRERLGIAGELVYALKGLDVPVDDSAGDVLSSEAARLLLQRARLCRPDLAPDATEIYAIAQLCRLVQGMPLALTLAASWAELLSLREIAVEIVRSIDFLGTERADVPERQRSFRAVFEGSWRRLPTDTQHVFARLTVFHGGFARQATEHVAGADLRTLRRLINASMMNADTQTQRYEIHTLLRQLAAEHLHDDPLFAAACEQHSAYFLTAVVEYHRQSLKESFDESATTQPVTSTMGARSCTRRRCRHASLAKPAPSAVSHSPEESSGSSG